MMWIVMTINHTFSDTTKCFFSLSFYRQCNKFSRTLSWLSIKWWRWVIMSDDEEPSNNGYEFPNSITLKEDHRLFDHMTYETLYNWFYYSYSKNGFMCDICTVFYGDNPEPVNQHMVQKVLGLIKVYYLRIIQGKNCNNTNDLMITKMPFVQKLIWK